MNASGHGTGRPSVQSMEMLDQLLAHYVAGSLPDPLRVLIGAHVEIKDRGRNWVGGFEILAGQQMELIDPVALSDRDRILGAVFDSAQPPAAIKPGVQSCTILPKSLVEYTGHTAQTLPWRNKLPGLKQFRIAGTPGFEANLYWIRPGRAMPNHTHDGSEVTLVLDGGFSDGLGHYLRGDVAGADETVDHRPLADNDVACICFAVTTAPLKMTGSLRQLFSDIFGG